MLTEQMCGFSNAIVSRVSITVNFRDRLFKMVDEKLMSKIDNFSDLLEAKKEVIIIDNGTSEGCN